VTTPQQNLNPNEVELKDLLSLFEKNLLLKFNCHHIAQIQDFNPAQQTASATINYKKSFSLPNSMGVYTEQLVDYPLLVNCPVIFLGGGDGCLTFPVQTGDDCLVLFNDRDIDNWFSGSITSAPRTGRLHAFPDAIIIVGLRMLREVIPSFSTDSVELRNFLGTTKISMKMDGSQVSIKVGPLMTFILKQDGTVSITNESGQDLLQTLANLFAAIPALTVLGVLPVMPPTYATDLAVLETYV